MPITFKLSKPLTVSGGTGTINELQLRELTARDLVRLKHTFITRVVKGNGDMEFETHFDRVMEYLAALSDVSEIELQAMDGADLVRAMGYLQDIMAGQAVKN